MLLTAWCLATVGLSLLVVGLPLAWLLNGRRELSAFDGMCVPFLGLAGIALPLENLVYLGLPVAQTATAVWLAGLALTAWLVWRGPLRASLASLPWWAFATAGGIFLVHAAGLLLRGALVYAGHAWSDEFNYTAMAEFFSRLPYGTPDTELATHPWLSWVVRCLRDCRPGQAMLQGFWAVSAHTSPRALFEPAILLGPALCVLVVQALAVRLGLGRRAALLVAAAAGLMPGLTTLHLDCFLSQSLAVPLLLLFLLLLHDLSESPRAGALLRAALLFNLLLGVYPPFAVVALGPLALAAGASLVGWAPRRLLAGHALLLLSPLALQWYFTVSKLGGEMGRGTSSLLAGTYPWALSAEGWARLWLGDLAVSPAGPGPRLVRLHTLGISLVGYLGLLGAALAGWRSRASAEDRRPFVLSLSLLALALLPLPLAFGGRATAYQFYKLLLSVGPLLVLGVGLVGRFLAAPGAGRFRQLASLAPAGLVLVLALAGTAGMVREAARAQSSYRSNAPILADPDLLVLQRRLERGHCGGVAISQGGLLQRSWLAYFARRRPAWLCEPSVVDLDLASLPPGAPRPRFDLPTGDMLFVTEAPLPFARIEPGDCRPEWAGRAYRLWRTTSPHWALPYRIINPYGIESLHGQPYFWVGNQATRIEVLAGSPGRLTLSATFHPGPSLPGTLDRRLLVRTSGGHRAEWTTRGGTGSIEVPVPAGPSTVFLQSLDRPAAGPTADPRTLLLGVQGLSSRFRPTADPMRSGPAGSVASATCSP